MAVYRIGDIIRMKREALGITREKLCELSGEICSVQTLYRMECGKVKVKPDIYRKLMQCMGQLPERNYASIKVSNYKALNLKTEIQAHLARGEYEQAEKKLEELEKFMDKDYVRNKQYLLEMKSKIAYRKKKMDEEAYLENLLEALQCTVPEFNTIEVDRWPYNCEEFDILIAIACMKPDRFEQEELLLEINSNIERKYVEVDYYVACHTYCISVLSQLLCVNKEYEKAIQYCKEGLSETKEQRILGSMYNLLYDYVWSTEQLIKEEKVEIKEREICKKLLAQAYYLSIAQGIDHHAERIKRLYNHLYKNDTRW